MNPDSSKIWILESSLYIFLFLTTTVGPSQMVGETAALIRINASVIRNNLDRDYCRLLTARALIYH